MNAFTGIDIPLGATGDVLSGIDGSGMERISISIGKNCRDNAPKTRTVTTAKLFERLQQRRIGPKDGKIFQLVSYTNGAHMAHCKREK